MELCTLGENHEVLRLQGMLLSEKELDPARIAKVKVSIFATLPTGSDFFADASDPNMAVYQFLVESVIFRTPENEAKEELNFRPKP